MKVEWLMLCTLTWIANVGVLVALRFPIHSYDSRLRWYTMIILRTIPTQEQII